MAAHYRPLKSNTSSSAYTDGSIPDYQMAAWLMAVVLRGMTREETAALTHAMLHSGEVLDLSFLPAQESGQALHRRRRRQDFAGARPAGRRRRPLRPHDQRPRTGPHRRHARQARIHSRISRRTCRSPDSIASSKPAAARMIGQTEKIAPADRKLYALRDVTGTVESPYLICASIMSKKLAEGTDALVLDVKTGSGAFMKKEEDAVFLAELMVETGERMGKQMVALITDMDQPLGRMVGNALEVQECIEVLHGGGPADLRDLCLEFAAWMFYLGGASQDGGAGQAARRANHRLRPSLRAIPPDGRVAGRRHQHDRRSDPPAGHRSPRRCAQSASRICDGDRVRTGWHRLRRPRRRPRTEGRFRRSRRGHRRA